MKLQAEHWLCAVGDFVAARYFNPPDGADGSPVLDLTAFHASLARGGYDFARGARGEPWVRQFKL